MQYNISFLDHLSRRLTRRAYRIGPEPASVRPSVRACLSVFTLSYIYISETSGPITIKLYLKHHWGKGKAALGVGENRLRTLVPMATDSSRRVTIGQTVSPLFLGRFSSKSFFYICR